MRRRARWVVGFLWKPSADAGFAALQLHCKNKLPKGKAGGSVSRNSYLGMQP